jgi:hypothetical protein
MTRLRSLLLVCLAAVLPGGLAPAQAPDAPKDPGAPASAPAAGQPPATPAPAADAKPEMSEEELVASIRRVLGAPSTSTTDEEEFDRAARTSLQGLELIDEFLRRFPASALRDDMLIHKLSLLSDLARFDPGHLGLLLQTTEEIAASKPQGRLAEECDYFAIIAFVMAARHENMPERTRLVGTAERYKGFLEDHPASRRGPVVFASLARCLLGLDLLPEAERTLAGMQRLYPGHAATRRVEGEVRVAKAIGQPMPIDLTFTDNTKLNTADHAGKVVVIGFWNTANAASLDFLRELGRLDQAHESGGLRVVGICLDGPGTLQAARSQPFQSTANFPQHYESKGLRSEAVVSLGVVELPTCYVFDRKGVLRAALTAEKVAGTARLVETLLAEEP